MTPDPFVRILALLAAAQREAQAGLQRHGWPAQQRPAQEAQRAIQRAQGAA